MLPVDAAPERALKRHESLCAWDHPRRPCVVPLFTWPGSKEGQTAL